MSAVAAKKKYVNLDVIVDSTATGFVARLESASVGQAQAEFAPPFSPQELELFLLRLARPRRRTRRIESPQMDAVKQFGESLFERLFTGELRACLRTSYEDAARTGRGLRIRIHPTTAPELADVPWEFLYHAKLNRFLALSSETPIVRYLDLPEAVSPLCVTPPVRILVVIAAPADLTELDVEAEWQRLHMAIGDLHDRGVIALDRLDNANMAELQRALRRTEYHVLHFVGHGGFDERLRDGVLVMEDLERRGVVVGAQRLGTLLHDHRSLRLIVLNACEGARTDVTDPFSGVAQTLVQQGLAAVVAMQFEVSDGAAISFASEFYGALADGYPVEAALAEARKAIFNVGNDTEWATPALYLRAFDGQLFDLKPVAAGADVVHAPLRLERNEAGAPDATVELEVGAPDAALETPAAAPGPEVRTPDAVATDLGARDTAVEAEIGARDTAAGQERDHPFRRVAQESQLDRSRPRRGLIAGGAVLAAIVIIVIIAIHNSSGNEDPLPRLPVHTTTSVVFGAGQHSVRPIKFGAVRIRDHDYATVRVFNQGEHGINLRFHHLQMPSYGIVSNPCHDNNPLEPGGRCAIAIAFSPTHTGKSEAYFEILNNNDRSTLHRVVLTGEGFK